VGKGAGGVELWMKGGCEGCRRGWRESLNQLDDRVLGGGRTNDEISQGTTFPHSPQTRRRLTSPTSSGNIERGIRMGILNPLYSATVSKK